MPNPDDDIEARVTTLEQEVSRLKDEVLVVRGDAMAARALAGAADRDVSVVNAKLNAHIQVLNALRETQLEHGEQLDALAAEMRSGFATMGAGMARITTLLERVAGPEPE